MEFIAVISLILTIIGVIISFVGPTDNDKSAMLSRLKQLAINNLKTKNTTETLTVLKTEKQTVQLISTKVGLECYKDIIRDGERELQWRLVTEKIKQIADKKSYSVIPGYKPNIGKFSIGPYNNRPYSKTLFQKPEDLHRKIGEILNLCINYSNKE